MDEKREHKRNLAQKLVDKYRLVILNEDTFEEKVSLRLTRLNVFVVVGVSVILLIIMTTVLIAFTGLREYIPGYSSTTLKQQAVGLAYKADSLQTIVDLNNQYLNSIKRVLSGDVKSVEFNRDSILENQRLNTDDVDLSPSKEDSLLRDMVVQEDKYNFLETATSRANYALFPPIKGPLSEGYNLKEKHFGVDIVATPNAPVKSVSDGTVIFTGWTSETGNVIIVEHSYGLVSVYKHNASLTKEQGERVRRGEVIATAGSTGEFSTGPHLHFELWSEGHSVNPTDFIDFQ
ncbi:M23 family metallopeptidase [Salinimicrobium flavum]|uniref:M23 family metallopeptidase n=1 Tax=Salinimicrobium flavum TaxID=1737065 RepID=A0ABW5IWT3_9FLAO